MSKKRNQVLFTKPEDPKFLKLIKQQAGYRDESDIDAKRAKLENAFDDNSDYSDTEEEQPQVVVIRSGDLTADEAERERQRLELENNSKPADLSERIVFKSKQKTQQVIEDTSNASNAAENSSNEQQLPKIKSKKTAKSAKPESKLSFAFDDDDDDGNAE